MAWFGLDGDGTDWFGTAWTGVGWPGLEWVGLVWLAFIHSADKADFWTIGSRSTLTVKPCFSSRAMALI